MLEAFILFSKPEKVESRSKKKFSLIKQNSLTKKYYENIVACDLILKQNCQIFIYFSI